VDADGYPVTTDVGEVVDEERRNTGRPMASTATSIVLWNGEG
jgi:hypothetical protein